MKQENPTHKTSVKYWQRRLTGRADANQLMAHKIVMRVAAVIWASLLALNRFNTSEPVSPASSFKLYATYCVMDVNLLGMVEVVVDAMHMMMTVKTITSCAKKAEALQAKPDV